jgi:hypothetical protein
VVLVARDAMNWRLKHFRVELLAWHAPRETGEGRDDRLLFLCSLSDDRIEVGLPFLRENGLVIVSAGPLKFLEWTLAI